MSFWRRTGLMRSRPGRPTSSPSNLEQPTPAHRRPIPSSAISILDVIRRNRAKYRCWKTTRRQIIQTFSLVLTPPSTGHGPFMNNSCYSSYLTHYSPPMANNVDSLAIDVAWYYAVAR